MKRPLACTLLSVTGLLAGCQSAASSRAGDASTTDGAGRDAPDAADARVEKDGHVHDAGDAGGPALSDAALDRATPIDVTPPPPDGAADACVGCAASKIEHLVLIVQENHTFDNYFGRYCTAPTGSNPTCTAGPSCCEAAPATDPSGATPALLDDAANGSSNPDHAQACELSEINGGAMDRFATGTACSSPNNVAYADSASASTYWALAGQGAIADRYFQPIAGASSSNDMYFARAKYVFTDNAFEAAAKGATCQGGVQKSYTDETIADLLGHAGVTVGVYAGGYASAVGADPSCASIPAACPAQFPGYPCEYDPGDIPFEFYATLHDDPQIMKDISQLSSDLAGGALPAFSFVKAIGYLSEHPGGGDTVSAGQSFVKSVVDGVLGSPYASSTLILITWDEGGGYFDHIAPPPASSVDGQPYGTRVPLLALGPFARKNEVSHTPLEHSSIVKLLEWNWLGQKTGQLGSRDAVVHNLGSLLDPSATGTPVPD